jgi:hypothetical protein
MALTREHASDLDDAVGMDFAPALGAARYTFAEGSHGRLRLIVWCDAARTCSAA